MTNVIYQVVKEFKTSVDGLDFEIKGRILKRVSGDNGLIVDYKWEISHYYKPLLFIILHKTTLKRQKGRNNFYYTT
jgi:hypothetical protein